MTITGGKFKIAWEAATETEKKRLLSELGEARFKDLANYFNDFDLVRFPGDAFAQSDVPALAKAFLTEIGLPKSAAPFLTFGPGPLDWIPERFRRGDLARSLGIGSNGYGDPIIIAPDGAVRCLIHDDGFADRYVGKDVVTFAEILLSLRQFMAANQDDETLPEAAKAEILAHLSAIDPDALQPNSFWMIELETL